ncbi:MAG: hypothetical protein WB608_11935, partial [Terracidiphilus sp.]
MPWCSGARGVPVDHPGARAFGPEGVALPQVPVHQHRRAAGHRQLAELLFGPGQQRRGPRRAAPGGKVHVGQRPGPQRQVQLGRQRDSVNRGRYHA